MSWLLIRIRPWRDWVYHYRSKDLVGLFRNQEGVKPGRWGFYLLGLEIGSRNPGNRVGVWLKDHGLWPW